MHRMNNNDISYVHLVSHTPFFHRHRRKHSASGKDGGNDPTDVALHDYENGKHRNSDECSFVAVQLQDYNIIIL